MGSSHFWTNAFLPAFAEGGKWKPLRIREEIICICNSFDACAVQADCGDRGMLCLLSLTSAHSVLLTLDRATSSPALLPFAQSRQTLAMLPEFTCKCIFVHTLSVPLWRHAMATYTLVVPNMNTSFFFFFVIHQWRYGHKCSWEP